MNLGIKVQLGHPICNHRHFFNRLCKTSRNHKHNNAAKENSRHSHIRKETAADFSTCLDSLNGYPHGHKIIIVRKSKKIYAPLPAGLILELCDKITFFDEGIQIIIIAVIPGKEMKSIGISVKCSIFFSENNLSPNLIQISQNLFIGLTAIDQIRENNILGKIIITGLGNHHFDICAVGQLLQVLNDIFLRLIFG